MTNSCNGKGKSPGSSAERKFIHAMQIHKTRLVLIPNLSKIEYKQSCLQSQVDKNKLLKVGECP